LLIVIRAFLLWVTTHLLS